MKSHKDPYNSNKYNYYNKPKPNQEKKSKKEKEVQVDCLEQAKIIDEILNKSLNDIIMKYLMPIPKGCLWIKDKDSI